MRFLRTIGLALAAAGLIGGCEPSSSGASGSSSLPAVVNGVPRADVEAIIKDYLLNNPAVLREAMTEMERYVDPELFQAMVEAKGDPMVGDKDAPITVVEYFDYNCGYCKQANPWVMAHLRAKEADVRFIFKELPILQESSMTSAKAALAAEKQGKYTDFHVAMMKTTDHSDESIDRIAKSVGLDVARMRKDMESEQIKKTLARVYEEAVSAGIQGTPAFLINGKIIKGFDQQSLDQMIAEARAKENG
jgi:protein-disulfide isomerase